MPKKLLSILFLTLFFQIFFAAKANAQINNPRYFDERFVVQALRTIHSAQITYQATVGVGTFGTFAELRQANLIDSVLASGEKYGYVWVLQRTHPTATMPAKFTVTATPRVYRKMGRRSFFIDEGGEMRGADKGGAAATVTDPFIDDCALYGIPDNERCTILGMRMLHGAEMTYQATVGNGNFGLFMELYEAGLINLRWTGYKYHGYSFQVVTNAQAPGSPAFFKINAVPLSYGVTGFRSFYIDVNGIVRGADHQGAPADENDPPIDF